MSGWPNSKSNLMSQTPSGNQGTDRPMDAQARMVPVPQSPAESMQMDLFSRLLLSDELGSQLLLGARLLTEKPPNPVFSLLHPGTADVDAAAQYFWGWCEFTKSTIQEQFAEMQTEERFFQRAAIIPAHLRDEFHNRRELLISAMQTLQFIHPGIDAVSGDFYPPRPDGSFDVPQQEEELLNVMMHWLARQTAPCNLEILADVKHYLIDMLVQDEARQNHEQEEQEMQRRLGDLSLDTHKPRPQQQQEHPRSDIDALIQGLDQLNIVNTENEAQDTARRGRLSNLRHLLRGVQQMVRGNLGLPLAAAPVNDDINATALVEEILVEHERHGGDRLPLLIDMLDMIKTSGVLREPGDETQIPDDEEEEGAVDAHRSQGASDSEWR